MSDRMNFLTVAEFYRLNQACRAVKDAFHSAWSVCLVGSAMRRRDFRDVDIRCILPDEEFVRLFPYGEGNGAFLLLNAAISEWIQARTQLPIDFQFQQETKANAEYPSPENPRNAVGMKM